MEPSPKGVPESFESVRSKLRESLAVALSLVSQSPGKLRTNIDASQNQDIPQKVPLSDHVNPTAASLPSEIHASERSVEVPTIELGDLDNKLDEGKCLIQENGNNVFPNGSVKISHIDGQEFRMVPINPNGTVSSSRDETESGHLTASCPSGELDTAESEAEHKSKRAKLEHDSNVGSIPEIANKCPQTIAMKIEVELFKLFGGVNKKYKEKARSLLFNLKDRNNPELRERVMSGEIAPNRLCAMTAEDLASKELSEWRIAKAEELAQMVVLPDSDVDIRRLVRKTHKGEFQVEVEQDDNIPVEVGFGSTLRSKARPKASNAGNIEISKSDNPEKPDRTLGAEKADSKDEPSNGSAKKSSDFIEFTVEELRDNEFLPPIVSLDEFVGSLESEPFENLSLHSGQRVSSPDGNNLGNMGSRSSDSNGLTNLADSLDKPDNNDTKLRIDSLAPADKSKLFSGQQAADSSHGEQVWDGVVQLNISATANVSAYLKGGEKTAIEDWPSFLEIKGRVRADAFEKFLQELRHSRSRAIMVVLFCWKEGSSENGLLRLREVSESYVEDERVGFVEPAPGVELYLCPLHEKMILMLGRQMPPDYLEPLKDIVEGLIGIIIWRKTHVTTISPKSTSHNHHRPGSKKHSSYRRQDKDMHHPTHMENATLPGLRLSAASVDDYGDIDDIPPGFGPAAAAAAGRDADDLPEFDFSRRSKSLAGPPSVAPAIARSAPPRPLAIPPPSDQMRELVHKYGQGSGPGSNFHVAPVSVSSQPMSGFGVEVQPWNDDDDIPEWRPRNCGPQTNKQQLMQGYQQQRLPLLLPTLPSAMRSPPLAPLPLAMPPSRSMPSQLSGVVSGQSPTSPCQVGQAWAHPYYVYQGSPRAIIPPNASVTPPCHFSNFSPAGNAIYARPNFSAGPNGADWRQ